MNLPIKEHGKEEDKASELSDVTISVALFFMPRWVWMCKYTSQTYAIVSYAIVLKKAIVELDIGF